MLIEQPASGCRCWQRIDRGPHATGNVSCYDTELMRFPEIMERVWGTTRLPMENLQGSLTFSKSARCRINQSQALCGLMHSELWEAMMTSGSPGNAWVRIFCSKDRCARIATFTNAGYEWQLSSISSTEAPRQSRLGGLPVAGRFGISPRYGGCPGCGSDGYARCGVCGELGCWASAFPYFGCANCGKAGEVKGVIESVKAVDTG
jgi:hypothetical protein